MWIYYAALPVGGVLMLVRYVDPAVSLPVLLRPGDHDGRSHIAHELPADLAAAASTQSAGA